MTEEVSSNMHVALIVYFTAAYLAIVVNVLVMSLSIYNNFGAKVSDQIVAGQNSVIYSIQTAGVVSAPQAYSAINQSLDIIDQVYYVRGSDEVVIYTYNDLDEQGLIRLMTTYRTRTVRVYVENSMAHTGMINIRIVEEER